MLIFTRPGIPAFCDTSKQKETSMITNRQLVKKMFQRTESQYHCKPAFSLKEQSSHECRKFEFEFDLRLASLSQILHINKPLKLL